ncbi:hypothetical protein Pfo_023237, partial [Paulownia fortunei]
LRSEPHTKTQYSYFPVPQVFKETLKKFNTRRFLQGSRPPNCSHKCEKCKPCAPVLVRVPPKTAVAFPSDAGTLEYYPLAWRCKCHGKLYKP